jgi:hypothetical protein
MAQRRGILDDKNGLERFDERRAVRRAGMRFTQNDNPLSRREVAGLRLRPEGQRDLDTTDRVGYWHQDWKAVAVDPRRLHHDAIDRLISIELKRPSHECGWAWPPPAGRAGHRDTLDVVPAPFDGAP